VNTVSCIWSLGSVGQSFLPPHSDAYMNLLFSIQASGSEGGYLCSITGWFQAQEEYRRKQDALRRQQSQGVGEIPSLNDLEYYSYLTEEGLITDCTRPDAKASVYAIFDQNKTLCYIGVSRQVSSENLELPTLPCNSLTLWFHCPFLFKTLQEYSSICDIWDYLCCP
jgi:hypothetical protein